MVRRLVLSALLVLFVATPLLAQARLAPPARPGPHQVAFTLGYFDIRGVDSRVSGDVLIANLGFLSFYPPEFNNVTFGGDYLFSLGDFIEVGGGVSYYSGSAPSVYANFVNEDGTEIWQELKLRFV